MFVRCGIRTHALLRGPELKSGAFDRSANLTGCWKYTSKQLICRTWRAARMRSRYRNESSLSSSSLLPLTLFVLLRGINFNVYYLYSLMRWLLNVCICMYTILYWCMWLAFNTFHSVLEYLQNAYEFRLL